MKVLFPDPKRMAELGYPTLSYCPYIISDDGTYLREANQYLRERSLAEWVPRLGQGAAQRYKARVQTVVSREAMARRLVEFLRWSIQQQKDWREVNYIDDLLSVWQPGLLLGTASTSGKKLKHSTVNALVTEAALFLTWAADRKYRQPFSLLLNTARVNKSRGDHSHSGKKSEVEIRLGSLPERPALLSLPSDGEIKKWIHEVHYLRGPVKALASETICRTGLRITECMELLVSDIPEKIDGCWPEKWLRDGSVPVLVHRGNKGQKIHPGSLESVNPRTVYLPLDLADRIAHYIQEGRSTLILRAINSIPDRHERDRRMRAPRPSRLWIGETSGLPFSSGMLYKAWTTVPSCPKCWHPHKGRELFAVNTIVSYMRDLLEVKGITEIAGVNQLGWLDGLMVGQIRIILSPLLGHVSEKTSEIYLKAAKQRLVEVFGHPALLWDEMCSDGPD